MHTHTNSAPVRQARRVENLFLFLLLIVGIIGALSLLSQSEDQATGYRKPSQPVEAAYGRPSPA